MSALKEKLIKYYKLKEGEIEKKEPVDIAKSIAFYAHDGQYRSNGDPYYSHPLNILQHYRTIFETSRYPSICYNIMNAIGIPTKGVGEVIWMHDVAEDTSITHEEIRELYEELGYLDYFNKYIDEPLRMITHDKKESYVEYMEKVLTNPTASLVKMFDLMDNLYLFSLKTFGDYEYHRAKKYIDCFKMINDKYHFIEKMRKYEHELNSPYKYDDWE